MTAEEYISQARYIDKIIEYKMLDLEKWKDQQGKISSPSYEPHYNANRNIEAPFIRVIENIDRLEREIEELIRKKMEIFTAIEKLSSVEERLVLRYHFIEHYSWREIQNLLHMSRTTANRRLTEALEHLEVPDGA